MSNLERLLDRKTAVLRRLTELRKVLDNKGTCITVGSGLDINVNDPTFSRIMDVLYLHEEECKEELRGIDRKIDAINELLGGL